MELLPDIIRTNMELVVFDQLAKDRLEAIPVERVLTCLYDIVPENLLDILGYENDMQGYKGFYFADTPQKKRDLLKSADLLKSTIGTPYAIIHALELIGIPNAIVIDNLGGVIYSGQFQYDGTHTHNGYSWANFVVRIPQDIFITLTLDQVTDLVGLIKAYKRLVCWLVEIQGYSLFQLQLGTQAVYP